MEPVSQQEKRRVQRIMRNFLQIDDIESMLRYVDAKHKPSADVSVQLVQETRSSFPINYHKLAKDLKILNYLKFDKEQLRSQDPLHHMMNKAANATPPRQYFIDFSILDMHVENYITNAYYVLHDDINQFSTVDPVSAIDSFDQFRQGHNLSKKNKMYWLTSFHTDPYINMLPVIVSGVINKELSEKSDYLDYGKEDLEAFIKAAKETKEKIQYVQNKINRIRLDIPSEETPHTRIQNLRQGMCESKKGMESSYELKYPYLTTIRSRDFSKLESKLDSKERSLHKV